MKNRTLFYALLGLVSVSCKKDNIVSSELLQGKWKEQIEGFRTHTNYFYYTFKKENNECQIYIQRDRYYYTTDTTIFKKYIFDEKENILSLFEDNSKNTNIEKYKVLPINSSTMHWKAVAGEENGRDKKMIKQKMGD